MKSPHTKEQFKKQMPRNAVTAGLSFLTYTLAAVWLTPYLIGHLGPAAYSLVPLAGLLTQYVSQVTAEISKSVTRFLTVEIQKPDGTPNAVFNSAFVLYLALIAIQLPLFAAAVWYSDRLFTIPEGLLADARLLFGFSAASFMVSLLGAVFGVSTFATNRLDLGSSLAIACQLARLALILICFSIWGPGLRFIGFVDFGLQVVTLGVTIRLWRKLTPDLKLSLKLVDAKILKPIFKMSSWTLMNRLGTLLYLRSDIWIINRFISAQAAGQYAAVLVVANFIRQMASQASAQFAPTIMNFWAKQDVEGLGRLLRFSVKALAVALAVPVAFLCVNGGDVLSVWLGAGFADQALLLLVLVVHAPVNTGILPLFTLFVASNSVKLPAIVTLVLGIANVVFSFYLGVTLEMGAMGVALATAVALSLKNACFIPFYSARILGLRARSFLLPMAAGLAMLAAAAGITMIPVSDSLGLSMLSKGGLAVQAGFLAVCCGMLGWCFFISAAEKTILMDMVPAPLRGALNRLGVKGSAR